MQIAACQGGNSSQNKKRVVQDEMEEDDEEMLIDLDQLDDDNRQILLEYLKNEYENNPDGFPFPKEIIEDYMQRQQQERE